MKKILVTRYWPGDAVERLRERYEVDYNPEQIDGMDRGALLEKLRDVDAVISMGDGIDREMIEAAPKLKVIADIWWGGRVDRDAARERGIEIITHHRGREWLFNTEAEHLFMLIMAVNRRLREADAFVRAGKFVRMEQANREMLGIGLKDHTLGIIGGTAWTGPAIVRRANAFEMKVVYWDHGDTSREMEALGARAVSLEELLEAADDIMMVVQRGHKGGYVLDKPQFDRMKPGVVIANVTSGALINEAALVEAIRSGRVRGAGLDKLEHGFTPVDGLTDLISVVLTPHADGADYKVRASLFDDLADGVDAILQKGGEEA